MKIICKYIGTHSHSYITYKRDCDLERYMMREREANLRARQTSESGRGELLRSFTLQLIEAVCVRASTRLTQGHCSHRYCTYIYRYSHRTSQEFCILWPYRHNIHMHMSNSVRIEYARFDYDTRIFFRIRNVEINRNRIRISICDVCNVSSMGNTQFSVNVKSAANAWRHDILFRNMYYARRYTSAHIQRVFNSFS